MLHTRKSFAKLCGVQEQQIGVYIRRGKIIEKSKRIDDNLPENKEFIEHRNSKVATLKQTIESPPTNPEEIIEQAKAIEKMRNLSTRGKELDIEKVMEEIELTRLKKLKLQGLFIPTDLVKILQAQSNKSIFVATGQAIEEIILEIGKKKSLSPNKIVCILLNEEWKPLTKPSLQQ